MFCLFDLTMHKYVNAFRSARQDCCIVMLSRRDVKSRDMILRYLTFCSYNI